MKDIDPTGSEIVKPELYSSLSWSSTYKLQMVKSKGVLSKWEFVVARNVKRKTNRNKGATTNKVAFRDGPKTSRKGHFSWLKTLPGRNGYRGGYRVPYGLATVFLIRGERGVFSHEKGHHAAWVSGGR